MPYLPPVDPLFVLYAALLLLWGYQATDYLVYIKTMLIYRKLSFIHVFGKWSILLNTTLHCFFLIMAASVVIQLMFSDGQQQETQL